MAPNSNIGMWIRKNFCVLFSQKNLFEEIRIRGGEELGKWGRGEESLSFTLETLRSIFYLPRNGINILDNEAWRGIDAKQPTTTVWKSWWIIRQAKDGMALQQENTRKIGLLRLIITRREGNNVRLNKIPSVGVKRHRLHTCFEVWPRTYVSIVRLIDFVHTVSRETTRHAAYLRSPNFSIGI